MLFSYNWLKELIPDLTQSPEEVARLLTTHSFETVIAQRVTLDPKITVVKVEQIDPHPNADRLRLITVTDGQTSTRIVCGAHNFEVGAIVAWAPPGSQVQDENGQPFVLKEAKIRGEMSPGMLTSWRELGLGALHSGIFVLPETTPLGSALVDHIPADTIFEAEIMPNRAHDCLSLVGIARELAALLELTVHEPETIDLADCAPLTDWQITLADPEQIRRYMGAFVTNVQITASPLWLQARLLSLGARPINVLVDITNYVMFELGNPIHAFDAVTLPSRKIGVRGARAGEQIVTLDGVMRGLQVGDLVITSDEQPIALAGIMGGRSTEVSEQTQTLFWEVANFAPEPIQQTSLRLGLRTEGAIRWSKNIEPARVAGTMARSLKLLTMLSGATVQGVIDVYPVLQESVTLTINPQRFSAVAGTDIPLIQAKQLLERVRFEVEIVGDKWQVRPPLDRLDITGEHDVVEEVIRLVGLEQIPVQKPEMIVAPLPDFIQWREMIRDVLVTHGYTEIYSYSFEVAKIAKLLRETSKPHITLSNPVAPELANLRTSLLPGLLAATVKNQLEFRRQALFEIGTVFTPEVEKTHLALVLTGEDTPEEWVQGLLYKIAQMLGVPVEPLGAAITTLSSEIQKQLKLRQRVVYVELDLDELVAQATRTPHYKEHLPKVRPQYQTLSKFPPVFRDMAVLVPRQTTITALIAAIEKLGHPLVVAVDLFDVYTPTSTTSDRYSLAFQLKYQAPDRTLTASEVEAVHNRIIKGLETEFSAVLRT